MKTPVDRNDQPLSAYLLKILTIIVKQSGGEVRIDATLMLDESSGEGLTKSYDREKRQLVLTFLSPGSEVFFNKPEGDSQWQPPLTKERSSQVRPLVQSDLMDSSTSASDQRLKTGSTLNDQMIVDLEDHYRKQAAARLVATFPSAPVTEREPFREASQPLRSQPKRVAQPQFFRD